METSTIVHEKGKQKQDCNEEYIRSAFGAQQQLNAINKGHM